MTKTKNTPLHIASPSIKEIEASGYMIQPDGTILSKKGCPLSPRDNGTGYQSVVLYLPGRRKMMQVHRLVALKYIVNPDNLPEVNHIDEIKSHNDISNLQWVTHKQNANHGNRTKPVLQLDLDGTIIRCWSSATSARAQGYCKVSICNVCKGRHKTHAGYRWAYDEVQEAA